MTTEAEKRQHRCCFAGHRPEKLKESEQEIKAWLTIQIEKAVQDGYVTFLTGMAMGVDLWAGQLVLEKKQLWPLLHLIAVTPYPSFPFKWKDEWREIYEDVWEHADHRVIISKTFDADAFERRNRFLVDHASRLIAFPSGEEGSTSRLIQYAGASGLSLCIHTP